VTAGVREPITERDREVIAQQLGLGFGPVARVFDRAIIFTAKA